MSSVRLENLAKRFATTTVVADVSLDVAQGELVALLGPSGSGKTTLLRLIAGFESADHGRILLDGDDVTSRPALARRCGMVFQHYALFPHLSVGDNVAYGLAGEHLSRSDRDRRVAEALETVDLAEFEARSVTGAWIVVSRRRTFVCSVIDRAISSCNCGGSFSSMSSVPGSAAESFTLVFSRLAWLSVISPSFTARCSSSHEANCIRRVVRRMLSVA